MRSRTASEARGIRGGYAIGVMATTRIGPRSHIRVNYEFITAVDAICASAPYKKLLNVALHVLGRK